MNDNTPHQLDSQAIMLTRKQRLWAEAYMGECKGNAVESTKKAGYKGSYSSLAVQGHDNLNNPKIKAYINARERETASAKQITPESVLANVAWGLEAAKTKGDLVSLARFAELQGKWLAMWTEKTQIEDINESKRMDAKREDESRAIAHLRLRQAS